MGNRQRMDNEQLIMDNGQRTEGNSQAAGPCGRTMINEEKATANLKPQTTNPLTHHSPQYFTFAP